MTNDQFLTNECINYSNRKFLHWLFVIVSLVIFASLFGCARTVTSIVTYGDQMVVEVTLSGTLDATNNRYFMVLASTSGFKVPLPPPDNISFECVEPGEAPQQGSIADYYANFYLTWAGYIITEPAGYFSVPGPFVQGKTLTRESISTLSESRLKYTFSLSRIFGASIPNPIHFDFISVPWPAGSAKLPADRLNSTNAYVSKVAGSTISIDDETNAALDPAADIIKCIVTIQ